MHITEFYKNNDFVFSFEIMPPRNGIDIKKIINGIESLRKYDPKYVSITQSSSDSLRGGSAAIATKIKSMNIEPLSHFVCAKKTRNDIENELMGLHYLDIQNILAIRGDPPWGESEFKPFGNGFSYAHELVHEIQNKNRGEYIIRGNDKDFFKLDEGAKFRKGVKTNFCVGVAGYPEGHRDCKDPKLNIKYLKRKIDEGANYVIAQMFYKPEYYFSFVKNCRENGITVPIIPAVMPILFYNQIKFLKETCAITIPEDYLACLDSNKNYTEFVTPDDSDTKYCSRHH